MPIRDGHAQYETDEAREVRERYNRQAKNFVAQPVSEDANHVNLPCAAGVAWVDVSIEEKSKDSVSASPDPTFNRGRRISFRMNAGADENKDSSVLGQVATSVLGWGRWKKKATDDSFSEASQVVGRRSTRAEEEAVALQLLQYVIDPQAGAEEAKATATRSAQIRESYVAQEIQTRQMWRVVMGNAPGLKAEIAKLHATERAKLALREFELQQHGWREKKSSSSSSSSSSRGGGSSSSSSVAYQPVPHGPSASHVLPNGSSHQVVSFSRAVASDAHGTDSASFSFKSQTGGGSGLFSWLSGSSKNRAAAISQKQPASPSAVISPPPAGASTRTSSSKALFKQRGAKEYVDASIHRRMTITDHQRYVA